MSDNYTNLILEEMNSKFDAVIELVQDVNQNMARKDELAEVKTDVKTIKAAIKDLSHKINAQETKIADLSAA